MVVTERVIESDASAPESGETVARAARGGLIRVYAIAFALAGFSFGIVPLHDNSFMWHLRTGQWILDNHAIPHHDMYSFTASGANWVAQSWLAELGYGVVERYLGGAFGLRLLGAVLGMAIALSMFRLALHFGRDRLRAGAITGLGVIVMLNIWSLRPLMFGILAMIGLIYCVERPDTRLGRHLYVSVPVIVWLWTNVHGTFVLGYGYLALHVIGSWFEGRPPTKGRERILVQAAGIALVASVLNPYGLKLLFFPFALMGRGQVLNGVEEWMSPNFRDLGGQLFGAWIVLVVVALARKRPGVRDLLVSVVFLMLALWAARNIGLAVVVTLPVAARLFSTPVPRRDEPRPMHRVTLLVALVAFAGVAVHARAEKSWNLKTYPVKAFAAVKGHGLEGPNRRIFTTDSWGGYLIAAEWPKQRVFYDDRYDMYPLALEADYNQIANGGPRWHHVLDDQKVEIVMWSPTAGLAQLMHELPDWQEIYRDKVAVVWVRKSVLASAAR